MSGPHGVFSPETHWRILDLCESAWCGLCSDERGVSANIDVADPPHSPLS
jgi:hypothetical protein